MLHGRWRQRLGKLAVKRRRRNWLHVRHLSDVLPRTATRESRCETVAVRHLLGHSLGLDALGGVAEVQVAVLRRRMTVRVLHDDGVATWAGRLVVVRRDDGARANLRLERRGIANHSWCALVTNSELRIGEVEA